MRRILVDAARHKATEKHGGNLRRQALSDQPEQRPDEDLIALDEALSKLSEKDPQAAKAVEVNKYHSVLGGNIPNSCSA
jgi:hypothetical protein